MALQVIAGGMAAISCRIASFNCSTVAGRRASPCNLEDLGVDGRVIIDLSIRNVKAGK